MAAVLMTSLSGATVWADLASLGATAGWPASRGCSGEMTLLSSLAVPPDPVTASCDERANEHPADVASKTAIAIAIPTRRTT
jgi:hypothetical protein